VISEELVRWYSIHTKINGGLDTAGEKEKMDNADVYPCPK
jgi:hypothetical protein